MENHLTKKSPTPNSNKTPNLVSKRSAMLDKIHASLMYMKFSRLCTNLEGGSKNLMKMKKKMGKGTGDRTLSLETIKTNKTQKRKENGELFELKTQVL